MSEYVIKTASGSIASFSDGADNAPCKSVKCSIIASGGGGTPSAPVPIVGASSITVSQRGKNLIDDSIKYLYRTNYIAIGNENDYTIPLKAGTYTLTVNFLNSVHYGAYIREQNAANQTVIWTTSSSATTATFTLANDGMYRIWLYSSSGVSVSNVGECQLEVGSSSTTYEAYKSKTPITVSLGQTVYGGTLAEDGTLTVTHAINTIDGDSVLTDNGTQSYGGRQVGYTPSPEKEPAQSSSTQNSDLLCDYFGTDSASGGLEGKVTGRATNNKVYFSMPSDVTTLALAKQWFTDNPTHLVYKLATPIVITGLDEISLSTYLGDNNIWCDSGDIMVEYYFEEISSVSQYFIKGTTLTSIADAIRTVKGTSDPIEVDDFVNEIDNMSLPLLLAEEVEF